VTADRSTARPPADPRRLSREGFTLVEVLAAMMILAVGLLALEAMAIGAARRIAAANLHTEYTMTAGEEVERALTAIRQMHPNPTALSNQRTLDNGTVVQSLIEQQAVGTGNTLFQITVTVTPPPGGHLNLTPVIVRSRAIR
jgi:prepilin-type N-terminal cleavage/methylation domain-containing protein